MKRKVGKEPEGGSKKRKEVGMNHLWLPCRPRILQESQPAKNLNLIWLISKLNRLNGSSERDLPMFTSLVHLYNNPFIH